MRILAISAVLCLLCARNSYADFPFCIDSDHSSVRIQVEASGLLGGLGHDHQIEARGVKGCTEIDWDQLDKSSISVTFATADIRVLDPDHPGDRAKVQAAMETEVLRIHEFPQIEFKSEAIKLTPGRRALDTYPVTIEGELTIEGHSQKISLPLVLKRTAANSAKLSGTYVLKQSAFGITPIKVMGGVVKVKDEIQLQFDFQLWQR